MGEFTQNVTGIANEAVCNVRHGNDIRGEAPSIGADLANARCNDM